MKRRIKLSEKDLHRVIKESVKRVLNEVSTDKAIAAHKAAQDKLDWGVDWQDPEDRDRYYKRQRQADTFLDYAQENGAQYYPYGVIGWYMDEDDGVFDRSKVVLGDSVEDVPDAWDGVYALTREGRETYDQWCDDASCGYDLCYGRMKGIAAQIGGGERDIWNYLTTTPGLAKRIK